jgi:hypothetical protein
VVAWNPIVRSGYKQSRYQRESDTGPVFLLPGEFSSGFVRLSDLWLASGQEACSQDNAQRFSVDR